MAPTRPVHILLRALPALGAALVLALAGCGGDDEDGTAGAQGERPPAAGERTGTEAEPGAQREDDGAAGEAQEDEEPPPGGSREGSAPEAEDQTRRGPREGGRSRGDEEPAGPGVEVRPVEPGSDDCELETLGGTTTVPCEQAERFFGLDD